MVSYLRNEIRVNLFHELFHVPLLVMGNDGPDLFEVSDLFFLRKRFQSGVEINKLTLIKGEEPNSVLWVGFIKNIDCNLP